MNNVLKFTLKKQNERLTRKIYNIFQTTFDFMVHTLYYVDKAVTNKKRYQQHISIKNKTKKQLSVTMDDNLKEIRYPSNTIKTQ